MAFLLHKPSKKSFYLLFPPLFILQQSTVAKCWCLEILGTCFLFSVCPSSDRSITKVLDGLSISVFFSFFFFFGGGGGGGNNHILLM